MPSISIPVQEKENCFTQRIIKDVITLKKQFIYLLLLKSDEYLVHNYCL